MQQEFVKSDTEGGQTNFRSIYKVKIWAVTLRELLLFQSIYVAKTQSDIVEIVTS